MASILIVDDEDSFRQALKRYLELEVNWTVYEARSADEAIALIPSIELDGIILDRRMPGKSAALVDSGDDVVRWLYSRQLLSEVCVVMLTGFGELDSARTALSMGAWHYLTKPLFPRDIHRLLAPGIALKKCHRLRRRIASAESTESVLESIQDVVKQTLAPDLFHVIFLSDEICRDMTDGSEVSINRRFVQEIRAGKSFLYANTRESARQLDPVLPDAGTLMAVRVVVDHGDTFGVMVMESRHEAAFDPRWQEVLGYLADLVGLSVTIRRALNDKVEAEQRQMETERQAKRHEIENLQLFLRELRHRLSTSIGTMYTHIEGVLADLNAEATQPGTILKARVIKKHLTNFVSVMKDLRDASMPVTINLQKCLLADLAADVLREKQADLDKHMVRAIITPGVDVHSIADQQKLEYCLQCIIQNAIEAVVERRTREPASSRRHASQELGGLDDDIDAVIARARSQVSIVPPFDITISVVETGKFAEIRVRDEGVGFDEEIHKRLFSPLFTTKADRELEVPNDGIGLYTVKRLIEAMGGTIEAKSDGTGTGSEFVIQLELAGEV